MPIKPENKHRYPAEWKAISLQAKERARWRCQHPGCTAMQYSIGHWIRFGGGEPEWRPLQGNRPATTASDNAFDLAGEGCNCYGNSWTYSDALAFFKTYWRATDEDRPTIIVLTVAHLDHQPENCKPENLRVMCQRHHLAYDTEHHKHSAQLSRRTRGGQIELFAA